MTPPPTITVDQFIARPPGRVWTALTTPELLAAWWVPGDIEPTVGHEFLLEMPGWGAVPCVVLEVDEPERLGVLVRRLDPDLATRRRGHRAPGCCSSTPASTWTTPSTGSRSTTWAPAGATRSCRDWRRPWIRRPSERRPDPVRGDPP